MDYLLRRLIPFEYDATGGGDPGGDGGGAEPGAAPADAGAATTTAGETPEPAAAAPGWAPQSQDDLQRMIAESVQQALTPYLQQEPQAEEPFELDPYDPASIDEYLERKLSERLGQYEPAIQAVQQREIETQVDQWVTEAAGQHGWVDPTDADEHTRAANQRARDMVQHVAPGFLPYTVDGQGRANGQMAVSKAAEYVADVRNTWIEYGKKQALAELEQLGRASADGGRGSTGGTVTEIGTAPKNEHEAAMRFVERMNAG